MSKYRDKRAYSRVETVNICQLLRCNGSDMRRDDSEQFLGHAMQKRVFGYRSISIPEETQSDQGLRCPLTKSLDTIECINREQRPGCGLRMRRMM